MKTPNPRLLVAAIALAIATSLQAAEPASSPLAMDKAAIAAAGIVVDTAGTRTLSERLAAPGEVRADAYSTVLVSPRIDSHVVTRNARLGDIVKAGQPLVTLSSVEVAQTQGALIVADADWRRVAALGEQAVSARRYNEARVARDQAVARLRAYGLSEAQVTQVIRGGSARADGSYALLSPVGGRVTTDDFLVGERVAAGRTLFTVVQENHIWVEARMPPADAARVTTDAAAEVVAHGVTLPAVVLRRGHQTDERTRTVAVRLQVDNRDDQLHPGELVDVRIDAGDARPSLAVPAESIVLLRNQPTVFVVRSEGRFEPVPVTTGETRDGWTVVTQGIAAGDAYVRKGAFALKARLLRSELGDD
ncbi:cobalt-zinc-cadmium efflux system membrane fusion protein [Luteibacter rhizovicinus]|uniref:Cobalt-zinc-cadmium efflux system membrane fusion protein n=1 Tax=Luteibacter rhizovicinus TaxID=242606 RepID=A0A4R3YN97_9GAMM|nr:efflux RND transporter periplasmic adaptor subunit [Luteibacter rhizovicinus]TCV93810.1 cobalt-zinc-cadmium efflux system membrane fusion protein [Luteibacter rhizovicinus]